MFDNIENIVIFKLIEEPQKVDLCAEKFFSLAIARHIFSHIKMKVQNKATYFDLTTICQEAATSKFPLTRIFEFLMIKSSPIQSTQYFIAILKDTYFKAKIKESLIKRATMIDEPNNDFYETFTELETLKEEVDSSIDTESETLQKNINNAINLLYERKSNHEKGIKALETGFVNIDKYLTIRKGDMILVAARPSMGKTSFANNIAINVSKQRFTVLYVSVEMSKESLTDRFVLSENENVSSEKYSKGYLSDNECMQIENSVNAFNDLRIFIEDKASYIDDIVRLISIEKRKHNIDVCIIDYIQLIKTEKNLGAVENTSEISKKIKSAAKDNDIPIIALSQLNRSSEQRNSSAYQLSDLRGSGSLEEDADIILFLHRELRGREFSGLLEEGEKDDPQNWTMDIFCRKNRNGQTFDAKLFHNKTVTKFKDNYISNDSELPEFNNNNDFDAIFTPSESKF